MPYEQDLRWRMFYDRVARFYDWQLRLASLLIGVSEPRQRRELVQRLKLEPDGGVLEVSVGTGSNLSFVAQGVGPGGRLVGLDISAGMLRQCQKKLQRQRLRGDLVEGEAAHLPFADGSFDAVLHFGGINGFDDEKGAIEEMVRVARPGARIVIGDEGLPPGKRTSLRNRLLVRINKLFLHEPPMDLVPPGVQDLHLAWFWGETCYVIDFVKP